MPLYDFVCQECEHSFETLVRNGQSVSCPKCKSEQVQRMLPLPARPPSESASSPASACRSEGPPCGPVCSRWKG
jgi:putative FmdB family regulatory protein